jgi:hypothetical protein
MFLVPDHLSQTIFCARSNHNIAAFTPSEYTDQDRFVQC